MTSKSYTVEEATKRIEHYCAYQERCHQEVALKLKSMGMIPEAIDYIMVHLIQSNFLNESRYAKAFVSGKFRIKKWGKQRLKTTLKQKGIHATVIKQALDDIDLDTYLQVLDGLAKKQCATIKATNKYAKKQKLCNYLLYRGWESHLVYEKVNALIN